MTSITVEGSHRIYRAAERGTLQLTVSLKGTDRDRVVRTHADLHNEVAAAVRARREAGAATWYDAGRISVWAYTPDPTQKHPKPVTTHRASSTIEAKYADLAMLADDVAGFSAREGVAVGPVQWSLTEATRTGLQAEAAAGAIADATKRALTYAEAIRPGGGVHLALARVIESHLHGAGGGGGFAGTYARGAAMAMADSAPAEITTPDLEVSASVVAEFQL
ncbi:SIMPL domain-containing protein [Microbacterium marinilacus]|uniref:SIMPL domain-containing protein n=1 Tax=Microbacterium marinilacus TaxID=415209 RepID=A0ABP7B002_9MICO|nr:SIMPL domain-containing protein [Microbacterium marinilacus]MBY0690102.1 SIMPL domain-containing protein [Microbacterium marinilacus]